MNLFSDFRVAVRLILSARFLTLFLWLSIALVTIGLIAAQFSARQPATVTLDLGLTVFRIALPVVAVLLLQELLSREFDRKLFLSSLTYPRPRYRFLIGRFAAIFGLLLIVLVVLSALLSGLITFIGHGYTQSTPPDLGLPYLVTLAFIALDLLVVLAIGTLIAVTTTTPSFVLIGTLGFMLVARSYSAIVALLTRDSTLVGHADTYQSSLSLLGYLLPDLAALDVRMISLYGQWQFLPEDWALRVVSALAYAAALLGLSVWALNRKKFA